MGIEVRGDSFRAKFYQGRRLVAQETFPTRVEAERFLANAKWSAAAMKDHAIWVRLMAPAQAAYLKSPNIMGGPYSDEVLKRMGLPIPVKLVETGPTLGHFIKKYRDEVTPTKRGRRQEEDRIKQFLLDPLAKRPIASLTKEDFRAYRAARLKQVKSATVTRALNHLHAIIEHSRNEWDLRLPENPASVKSPAGSDVQRDRRLVSDEEERLLKHADHQMRDTILIALATAMRRGELILLDASMLREIDTNRAHIILPREITKTGRERAIPAGDAIEVLRRLSKREGPLLGWVSGNALTMSWNRLVKRAGIEDLRFHDLRHEGTSRLVECRLYSDVECMSISGHKTLKMFWRYLKPNGGELAARRK